MDSPGETFDAQHASPEPGCGANFQEPAETTDIPGHHWALVRHLCIRPRGHATDHTCYHCSRVWPSG
jgi:hypothetical protein